MERQELDLQVKLRNIGNIKTLLSEGLFPGKYKTVLFSVEQFLDELGQVYGEKLKKYQPDKEEKHPDA